MNRIRAFFARRGQSQDGVPGEGQGAVRVVPRFRRGFAPDGVPVEERRAGLVAPRFRRGFAPMRAGGRARAACAPRFRGASPMACRWKSEEPEPVAPRFRRGFAPDTVVVGFTLIEILVVVVIVGVLALAVTISIATAGGERQLARESERLQGLIDFACHQAELTGREIGLRLDGKGYAFTRLGFDGWNSDALGNELRPRDWVPGLRRRTVARWSRSAPGRKRQRTAADRLFFLGRTVAVPAAPASRRRRQSL